MMCKRNEYLILQSIISMSFLILGGFIYLLFRPKTLLMFRWFEFFRVDDYVDCLRGKVDSVILGEIVLYSFPNGLWISSYILLVNVVVSKKDKFKVLFWAILLPLVSIIFELLQVHKIIPGVFDLYDIIFYIFPLVVYLIYLRYERVI